jgi:hypothetical protein
MFAKNYHPTDSRHPDNRAKTKEMKARRFGETRGARQAQIRGGVLNTQTADDIRALLTEIETAPVIDRAAQKRLKKRLIDPARKQGEKEFWQNQPWWGRVGPLRIFNQFRAIDAGEKAAGSSVFMRIIGLPAAMVLLYVMMHAGLDEVDVNTVLIDFLNWLLSIANAIITWVA